MNRKLLSVLYLSGCLVISLSGNKAWSENFLVAAPCTAAKDTNLKDYCAKATDHDEQAISFIEGMAEQKNAEAAFIIGTMRYDGQYIEKNVETGINNLEISAKLGFAPAKAVLADILITRRGSAENIARGTALLKEAVEQGYSEAWPLLIKLYARGEYGVKPDHDMLKSLLEKAVTKSDPTASVYLAEMLFRGEGTAADPNKAFALLEKIAGQGNQLAADKLIELYLKDEKTAAKALPYVKNAAAIGNSEAIMRLANMYLTGYGTAKNFKAAFDLYQSQADKGDLDAQVTLAAMYLNGQGVKPSRSIAFQKYQEAAAAGHPHAQYMLGRMYAEGYGVKKSPKGAEYYYDLASKQGYEKATQALAELKKASGATQGRIMPGTGINGLPPTMDQRGLPIPRTSAGEAIGRPPARGATPPAR
ncbi:MAG: tetratricopeptide repeat protein [Alphaproteobacteria bacterium]